MRGILKEKEWSTLFRPSAAITTEYMPTTYIFTDNGILIKYIIELQKVEWVRKVCFAQNAEHKPPTTKNSAPIAVHRSKLRLLISVRRFPKHRLSNLPKTLGPGNREIRVKPPMQILI